MENGNWKMEKEGRRKKENKKIGKWKMKIENGMKNEKL